MIVINGDEDDTKDNNSDDKNINNMCKKRYSYSTIKANVSDM